jgi:uncharacterized protein YtpQ (UPF0354 family)
MMRLVVLIGVALMFARVAVAETLSPHEFTEAFAAAATAAMPSAKVVIKGDLYLETRSAGGETASTDLRNAYERYRLEPRDLDDVIHRYVALLAHTVSFGDHTPPIDRSHILPVIKPTGWVKAVQEQRQSTPESQLLTEPFNGELMIVYAEDLPSSMRYLMTRDDVGDRGKLRALALANLNTLLPKIEMRPGADGVFLIFAGGEYEPSLLLTADIWSSGQIKVDGDIVVAVPAKGLLLVTGSHNQVGIVRMRAIAAKAATWPYALTPALFAYRGGRFVTFDNK